MRILLAASEAVPFCKTGGLADVVGALGQKLGAAGHDVCLVLPKYRSIEAAALQGGRSQALKIPLGGETVEAQLRFMQRRAVSVYFIDYPPFFDREGLYQRDGKDHPDNAARFALFSLGALEAAKAVGFRPDVVHVHDWQAAPAAAYLRRQYARDAFFSKTACVLTVHNMAYQGLFPRSSLPVAGFEAGDFTPDGVEYYEQVSYLKAGLVFSDLITTVSPTYAREIQESSERGFGFEGLLRRRSGDLFGVLNGLDTDVWNPARDARLAKSFSVEDAVAGKAACRAALAKECGLADDGSPLVGIVSRLDYQKGLDLAAAALEPRLEQCRLVAVGTGDPALHQALSSFARRSPQRVCFRAAFDEDFAHRVYAGSDLFLMPSRFEPCGLGQMIAMRYGSVPVAARTGGLADTVFEQAGAGPDGRPRAANGFLAEPGDAADLGRALDRAFSAFAQASWPERVLAGMSCDFSWDVSVSRYLELFELARSRAASRA